MICGDALILAEVEGVEVAAVNAAHEIRHVGALVVHRPRDRPRWFGEVQLRFGRREEEALIDIRFRVGGMIDDGEVDVVEVMRLPEVSGDAHVVEAVARLELIAAHLDPIGGLRNSPSVLCVDVEAEWRTPEDVGHELHLVAVPGEQERARAVESLRDRHADARLRLVQGEFDLRVSVGPDDAKDLIFSWSPSPKWSDGPTIGCFWTSSPLRTSASPPTPKELTRLSPRACFPRHWRRAGCPASDSCAAGVAEPVGRRSADRARRSSRPAPLRSAAAKRAW